MSSRSAYGGQAVIEGVMIRGKEHVATACRKKDGEIVTQHGRVDAFVHHPLWRLAFLRGTPALIDSLRMGYKTLMWSADVAMEGEEKQEKLSSTSYLFTILISTAFAIGLFKVLPTLLARLVIHPTTAPSWMPTPGSVLFSLAEGILCILILIGYILLVGRAREVKRIFAYHGAEHKVVNGYEAGADLTVAAVKPYSRIHPRCGTSFIFLFFFVGILLHSLTGLPVLWMLILSRIIMIPIVAGVAYELIRLAGRYRNNLLLKILVSPGMLLQRLTTAEPEDDQIEVALASMRGVLEDEGELAPAPIVVQGPESEVQSQETADDSTISMTPAPETTG